MHYQPSSKELLYVLGCPEQVIPDDSRSQDYRTLLSRMQTARRLFTVVCRTESRDDCNQCNVLDFKMCDRVMDVFERNGIVVIDPIPETKVEIKSPNVTT